MAQQSLMERVQELVRRAQETRLGRMNARYGAAHGAQLAGGIAYAGLFSVFAALTIAFTIFMALLGDNEELRDAFVSAVDSAIPGIINTGPGDDGVISPDDLQMSTTLSWTSVVASVTLLLAALAVMGALGGSLRAMFGIAAPPGNVVVAKLRDLGGFVLLALAVLATAVLGIGAGAAGGWVTDQLGLESSLAALLVRGLALVGAFAVDTFVFAGLIRFVGGARPPRKDLWVGAMIGAVGTGVLRLLGTSVVGGADANPLLQSFAVIVTLLLWVNLAARIALYVAAWTANPPSPLLEQASPEALHAKESPNYVTQSAPHTLAWDHDPRTGLVLASEGLRLEREEMEREKDAQRRELGAALGAALEEPDGWFARRRAARRARKAVRAQRERAQNESSSDESSGDESSGDADR
ncbi:YihY/virulence factor BrkB family protein [Miniimonas arenae]|uniref:YihY/virulence factor BrkB family protein n=1 Tax=Miniimonas arenae TaxID=676201 RepID=A0A5C5B982_9MICO|nr:YihY/virulence factor BrkB family protein [Miniimonas arenae]TNU73261.1 YihY/virulence factor BrkB family protein [Miniimonas arenae]